MRSSLQFQVLLAVLAAGMMFSSCGNIDIVKRKYRPGFHVDVSKKKQKPKESESKSLAHSRRAKNLETIAVKTPQPIKAPNDETLTASTKEITSVKKKKRFSEGSLLSLPQFKKLSFDRKMKTIKNEIFKPKPRGGGTHWMKWVAFGSGILSLTMGFFALLFAFLFASSWLIWPALIFSAAAIVFALLYKNANGTDPKARLGMIFGIIGGGLAVIALIVWAIWVSQAISPVL